jgi:hypothetical protein
MGRQLKGEKLSQIGTVKLCFAAQIERKRKKR